MIFQSAGNPLTDLFLSASFILSCRRRRTEPDEPPLGEVEDGIVWDNLFVGGNPSPDPGSVRLLAVDAHFGTVLITIIVIIGAAG